MLACWPGASTAVNGLAPMPAFALIDRSSVAAGGRETIFTGAFLRDREVNKRLEHVQKAGISVCLLSFFPVRCKETARNGN